MPGDKTFYITTPIYYVNGVPHVGSATTTLLCDALARYHRLRGEPTFFLTGTDEHGQKVADTAAKAGLTPQELVDQNSAKFIECWQFLDVSNDDFVRTTQPRHEAVVQEVFRRLQATGDIYPGTYEGWYSVADETFFRDSEVENGRAIETGAAVERITEDVYYFRLSAYGDRLLDYIGSHPSFLQPDTRRNEVIAFIKEGLRDLAITRRAKWGVEVPGDARFTVYVWFDALINYLAVTGWPNDPNWETLWPADVHLVGKEIYTRFHATLWPAILMGLGLPLPGTVLGHGWWLIEGEKGSKSKGNIPTPQEVVAELVEQSGAAHDVAVDSLRYYLIRDISFSSDSEFSLDNLVKQRYNPELCNKLGNLLNRSLKMLTQFCDATVPDGAAARTAGGAVATVARETVQDVERALAALDPAGALTALWRLVNAGNEDIDSTAPWKRHKEGDAAGVADALYTALETLRIVSILIAPFLPHVAARIREQLGLPDPPRWADAAQWGLLPAGTKTQEGQPIFPRIDTKNVAKPNPPQETKKPVTEQPNATTLSAPEPTAPAPAGDIITIDDFMRVHLRVAEIKTAERVEKAKKLLRLTVDVGEGTDRQLVAGIAESYAPEDLPGRKIVVVANLQPAVIRGVQSQGMLLAATDADGKAILLTPDDAGIAPGAKVK